MAADRVKMLDRYRLFWGHGQLAAMEDVGMDAVAGAEVLAGEGVGKAEALKVWIGQLKEEIAKRAIVDTEFTCVVGRKV